MRGLKRIAQTGRAVCATIHQPSIAIFNSFDSLLLLKRGGEVVFFGELGDESTNLITYLERYGSTPKIQPGENPATWCDDIKNHVPPVSLSIYGVRYLIHISCCSLQDADINWCRLEWESSL
jgi:ABC-type multidrug transport system ATPase subunit